MGHRTLSIQLVLRALFLDSTAYDELRDDDNPFVEGLFLLLVLGVTTAILHLIGQLFAWASSPSLSGIQDSILSAYQSMPWWAEMNRVPEAAATFQRIWDAAWQVFPRLFGAPDPGSAALNIVLWPVLMMLSWFIYGLLAHLAARLLGGSGTLNQMMGTMALSFTPLLLRGLSFIPFLALGSALNTWQLICRYKAIRSTHGLSWKRAFWATLLPYAVYLVLWLLLAGFGVALISLIARR